MAIYNKYSEEQQEFLRVNAPQMSRKELSEKFNAKFGTNKSELAIKSYCNARGFNSSNDGRFKDGNRSWQTGLSKDEFRSHYTEESFNRLTHNMIESNKTRRVGDEIIKRGLPYIVISTDCSIPQDNRIQLKRRYVWEQANGKIPEDHMILQLDGDPFNCDLSNLACVPIKYRPQLNKNGWLCKSKDMTLAAIKWFELYYALKDFREMEGEINGTD